MKASHDMNMNTSTTQMFVKEHLFEKRLTPSDVGKLNRLVIPKQYAEKYFPVISGSLVLSLVDESGKHWKFRYSYWNSSQSYVFTKGWSRFVKEKKLEAGDVVFFQRQVVDSSSVMFLGWRRRMNDGWLTSEKPEILKYKTVRLFGVNLECRTHEAQEDSIMEPPPPTPDHGCFTANMEKEGILEMGSWRNM
ncbi:hypothetical protein L2E82_11467 [Cichorium intybus]|uniref:Uncharacterized protein n=1 Tax=Cichorium intybus TaxID=13427 RepID=A0ACB9GFD8_CICIN|nr:hypothetical protein L2E82_11467 [Cichorium intybus]